LTIAGTTALLAALCCGNKRAKIVVGNVGDSRAILCRRNLTTNEVFVVELSEDHKLTRKEEMDRIKTCNGVVLESSTGQLKMTPGALENSERSPTNARLSLNMSRALGHPILSKFGVESLFCQLIL
jgi:serine/threonine protein phosphatase PrpC